MTHLTTVTNTNVNAAEFFTGIKARKFQSDGSSNSATSLAPVGTNPWGVSQMASPTTTIKKPILMTVRAETVFGMNRARVNGARINGRRNANDIGSGTG